MKAISEIIEKMSSSQAFVNPTEIYNEGWMTRLLMHYSVKQGLVFNDINFANKYWTSEALISSPFIKANNKREGYTHADIAFGDFGVNYKDSGKIVLNENAKVFGIIEAKMKSSLSKGTKHAPDYNQASRNVACIAFNTKSITSCKTFFFVAMPESRLNHQHKNGIRIKDVVKQDVILSQIEDRIKLHNYSNEPLQLQQEILERVQQCKVGVITYEEWIEAFTNANIKEELNDFYDKCITYNKVK